jgi:hypothetical protein
VQEKREKKRKKRRDGVKGMKFDGLGSVSSKGGFKKKQAELESGGIFRKMNAKKTQWGVDKSRYRYQTKS